VTRGLVERGYSDEDIENILGSSFLRVFKKVLG
jgi:membrane dipeptidase